jgi:polyhydroxyalkanoate synthesis regulator phasin
MAKIKAKAKKTKKRNPQDATRVNVQAANKRLAALEQRVATLEAEVLPPEQD